MSAAAVMQAAAMATLRDRDDGVRVMVVRGGECLICFFVTVEVVIVCVVMLLRSALQNRMLSATY